jgi:hypothetical protein
MNHGYEGYGSMTADGIAALSPHPHERDTGYGEAYAGRSRSRYPLSLEYSREDDGRRGIERGDERHEDKEL